jgi:hypothetical protein
MTLKIRKVQREDQSILLVVHDRSGQSHDLIEKTTLYLSEMIRNESTNEEVEDDTETDSNQDS